MNGGEVGYGVEESLEDLELHVYVLRVATSDRDDSRDRREGDGAQSDGELKGVWGNGDNFGIFRYGANGDGGVRGFCMLPAPGIQYQKAINSQLVRPRCVLV